MNIIHNLREKEVSIVHPDTEVRIIIFGFGMDDIALVAFATNPYNCSNYVVAISQPDFLIQTEKRVVVKASFPEFVL